MQASATETHGSPPPNHLPAPRDAGHSLNRPSSARPPRAANGAARRSLGAALVVLLQTSLGLAAQADRSHVVTGRVRDVNGGRGGAADVDEGVIDSIRTMVRDDGSPVFTPSSAGAALVFFVLSMQRLPTLTMTRRETGRLKYPALQLGYMSVLAYAMALLVGQSIRAAGLG